MTVLILVPAAVGAVPTLAGARIAAFATPAEAAAILAADPSPAVILTDTLDAAAQETIAGALRDHTRPCIEVRSARWDGVSPSPLSAACRGVISGFGTNALATAAALVAA